MKRAWAGRAVGSGGRLGAFADILVWMGFVFGLAVLAHALSSVIHSRPSLVRVAAPGQMLVLFVVASALLWRRGDSWRALGLAPPRSLRQVFSLVAAGYLGLILINSVLVLAVFPALHLARPAFGAFGVLKGHPGAYASWLVVAWLSAALGEELQFRGFLLSRLERLFGRGRIQALAALLIQAALFGLGHIYQGWSGVLVTSGAGLVLGAVYLAGRRNLVACIILHGLIDTVSLTILFLGAIPAIPT